MMKRRVLWGGVLAALLWTGAAVAQAPDLNQMDIVLRSVPDGPVAKVGAQTVGARTFAEHYSREIERLSERAGEGTVDDAVRIQVALQVLGRLVEDLVLAREAERKGLTVPEAELEKAWQNELSILRQQLKREGQEASGEADLLKLAGTTREEARADLRRAMLIDRMRERIAKDRGVSVSDAEVEKFVKENAARFDTSARYHVRHILIRPASARGKVLEADKAKARAKAEQALARIRSGQSFEAVAREVSEGPRREQGGDMGLLTLDEMGPVISAAVKALKPGEVSGVVESEFGYHLVQLVATQAAGELDLGKVRERVRQALLAEKAEKAVRDYVQKATEGDESVEIYLALDRQIALRPDLQEKLRALQK